MTVSAMINADQLDALIRLLIKKIGLRVPADAHDRIAGLMYERAKSRNFAAPEEYLKFLLENGVNEEWEQFARAFTSGETFFFRDNGQFDLLRLQLLPELIEKHSVDKTLRLWSAGCASGEEAYSLAMLLDMLLPNRADWNVLILGTDIDSRSIAKARQGRYGQWSFRMVPAALQHRYFQNDGGEWLLNEPIRSMVRFRVGNLVDEVFPDFGSELHDMDLILCRNVFIYFESSAVSVVAEKFSESLVEGGYLLAAHTELMGRSIRGLSSRLFAEGLVYQRRTQMPAYDVPQPLAKRLEADIAIKPRLPMETPFADPFKPEPEPTALQPQPEHPSEHFCRLAHEHADRGEYELAERMCYQSLAAEPLDAIPYFLLAQLAQLKESFEQAREFLNKAIYIEPLCAAAYLELAALYERTEDLKRAQAMRHAALEIVRGMPADQRIEPYESTAGELAQWLAQWEPLANNNGNNTQTINRSSLRGH